MPAMHCFELLHVGAIIDEGSKRMETFVAAYELKLGRSHVLILFGISQSFPIQKNRPCSMIPFMQHKQDLGSFAVSEIQGECKLMLWI